MLTTEQIRNRTKTVTRRLGWLFLKRGDILNACEKCQGLKKGEKIKKIWQIRVLRRNAIPLVPISKAECAREGFPGMKPLEFIEMFVKEMKCSRLSIVNRIEFEYLD